MAQNQNDNMIIDANLVERFSKRNSQLEETETHFQITTGKEIHCYRKSVSYIIETEKTISVFKNNQII